MVSVLAVLAAVFLGLFYFLGGAAVRVLRELSTVLSRVSRIAEESFGEGAKSLRTEIRDLEDLVDRLPIRWEDIQRETKRLDSRARHAVARVTKELEARGLSDDHIDELRGELRLVDGEGSGDEGMLTMPESVEGVPAESAAPAGDSDWREVARRRKFGA